MIRVDIQNEPSIFDRRVRKPGRRFLATNPHPNAEQFRTRTYWCRVLRELHDAYDGICAYSCHWIPYDTGADTVEHFLPKLNYPESAYEWSNYRLVCQTLNGRKKDFEDVLDPFLIGNGWFVIDFPSMLVKPSELLPNDISDKVIATIKRLGLNDESTCLRSRRKWIRDYCVDPAIPFDYLKLHAPFIGLELERQVLVDDIRNIFQM